MLCFFPTYCWCRVRDTGEGGVFPEVMRFDCPECDQGIEVEARFVGKEANCPYCDKLLTVPMVAGGPPRAELVVVDDEEEAPPAKWTAFSQKASATLVSALRILRRGE